MSTTRNNSKVCGDNVSLLIDTVHSLEVAQEFHFKKLERVIEKVNAKNILLLFTQLQREKCFTQKLCGLMVFHNFWAS